MTELVDAVLEALLLRRAAVGGGKSDKAPGAPPRVAGLTPPPDHNEFRLVDAILSTIRRNER